MSGIRTGPELRDETKAALAACARRNGCNPDLADTFALEALATLDGLHIGLKDLRTPPPVPGRPAAQLPTTSDYHAAREALRRRNDTQEGQT